MAAGLRPVTWVPVRRPAVLAVMLFESSMVRLAVAGELIATLIGPRIESTEPLLLTRTESLPADAVMLVLPPVATMKKESFPAAPSRFVGPESPVTVKESFPSPPLTVVLVVEAVEE